MKYYTFELWVMGESKGIVMARAHSMTEAVEQLSKIYKGVFRYVSEKA